MSKISVGIVGAAGYTAGELIRILLNHPETDMVSLQSDSQVGKPVWEVHDDLVGESNLSFENKLAEDLDVIFLCRGHGQSLDYLMNHEVPEGAKVIDLSQDFRLKPSTFAEASADKEAARQTDAVGLGSRKPEAGSMKKEEEQDPSNKQINELTDKQDEVEAEVVGRLGEFVYGLPELYRDEIARSKNIANPGCFATCLQLGLLPLAKENLIKGKVHISAITGSTGAGQGLTETAHFSWRNNNMSVYKPFTHQHLHEIYQSLRYLQPGLKDDLRFIPYRGNFTRGIIATTYLMFDGNAEEAQELYRNYYETHPFVHISSKNIHLKQVINTNKGLLFIDKIGNDLMIISAIDNLLKGASGQAVQNMNLMFGLPETCGLDLKPSAF